MLSAISDTFFFGFSEASMYLPVVPIMNKHRKSLNLLELPHPPQHTPQQNKASWKYLKSKFVVEQSTNYSSVLWKITLYYIFFKNVQ